MNIDDTIETSAMSEGPPILLRQPATFSDTIATQKPPRLSMFNEDPPTTMVYYYCDDDEIPYATEVPVHPSKFTLAHFKRALGRQNFKFHLTQMDEQYMGFVELRVL
jgi:hypothetical protein